MNAAPVYVISDVHGFRDDLAEVLHRAGLVDEDARWCGEESRLWVLGDLMDRGPDGIGVVDLLMSLQQQAPERVQVLMGNHDALAVGRHRFPETELESSWLINGGRPRDQELLTEEHVAWLSGLPLLGREGRFLLAHADAPTYLHWGRSVDEVNATVRDLLARGDFEGHWEVWAGLTERGHFAVNGAPAAREMLEVYGGQAIVHGHTPIGVMLGIPSAEVEDPLVYAEGLVVAIDGGRYDGGPLILVGLG